METTSQRDSFVSPLMTRLSCWRDRQKHYFRPASSSAAADFPAHPQKTVHRGCADASPGGKIPFLLLSLSAADCSCQRGGHTMIYLRPSTMEKFQNEQTPERRT